MHRGLAHHILFLHQPKTGGTTFKHLLSSIYKSEERFSILTKNKQLTTQRFLNLPHKEKQNIRMLDGHMNFGLHTHFEKESKYITILRDPVDRLLSNYHYILKTSHHYMHERIKDMSFDEYVRSDISDQLDNAQAHYIAGTYNQNIKESVLDKAIENLDNHFLIIGRTERFEETLALCSTLLGYSFKSHEKANKGSYAKDVNTNTIAIIAERNSDDYKLIAYANQHMNDLISKNKNAFNFAYRKIKRHNHWFRVYKSIGRKIKQRFR